MKQIEKLDILLKELYKERFNNQYFDPEEIYGSLNIDISENEQSLILERLEELGLIKTFSTKDGDGAKITSSGIEYCEEDSFSEKGSPVITNNYQYSISHSPNSNIVSHSTGVNIGSDIQEINNLLNNILSRLNDDDKVDPTKEKEIKECIEEIKNNLDKNNIPKFGIRTLITLLSNISSVGSFAVSLSQFI
ncbi:hypothetical protein [Salinimicrobium sp. GXAS 041]|uniref:hypothetical protein n=1 Tax=Salinimicrobium sp. GXAS 041 TaxID=3400806 RepID=UPI003C746813